MYLCLNALPQPFFSAMRVCFCTLAENYSSFARFFQTAKLQKRCLRFGICTISLSQISIFSHNGKKNKPFCFLFVEKIVPLPPI